MGRKTTENQLVEKAQPVEATEETSVEEKKPAAPKPKQYLVRKPVLIKHKKHPVDSTISLLAVEAHFLVRTGHLVEMTAEVTNGG